MKAQTTYVLLAVSLLSACGPKPGELESRARVSTQLSRIDQARADANGATTVARSAIAQIAGAPSCTDQTTNAAATVRNAVTVIEGFAEEKERFNGGLSGAMYNMEHIEVRQSIATAADLRLSAADALTRAKCYDQADELYRSVIATYTGASYAAFRERAKVGIDDIRDKRRAK